MELLVDGIVVRTEISYPYDLTTMLPTIAQTGNQAVLQVRATDTGGNIRLSDPIVIDLLADSIAPTITSLEPAAGSVETLSRRKVTLQFSEAIDPASAIAANFVLQGPGGPVTPISIDAAAARHPGRNSLPAAGRRGVHFHHPRGAGEGPRRQCARHSRQRFDIHHRPRGAATDHPLGERRQRAMECREQLD